MKFTDPIFSGQEKLYANVAKPTPRGHRAVGEGAGLWKVLEKNVEYRGIECMFDTRACELIAKRSSGKSEVFGVRAERKGETLDIKANKAVVLCTGGYSNNVDFFKKFCTRSLPFYPNPMVAFDNGDGITMAQAVGADLFAIDNVGLRVLISRGWPSPNFASYVRHPQNGDYIWANLEGKRFMDETTAYSDAPLIVATQPESRCYMIFDENTKRSGGESIGWKFSHDLSKEISAGAIRRADSVRNLAKIINIDPDTLKDTIDDWNKNAADGRDADFGRTTVGLIDTPPFYAGSLKIHVVSSYGGVKVNTKGQVIDVFDRPFPDFSQQEARQADVWGKPILVAVNIYQKA